MSWINRIVRTRSIAIGHATSGNCTDHSVLTAICMLCPVLCGQSAYPRMPTGTPAVRCTRLRPRCAIRTHSHTPHTRLHVDTFMTQFAPLASRIYNCSTKVVHIMPELTCTTHAHFCMLTEHTMRGHHVSCSYHTVYATRASDRHHCTSCRAQALPPNALEMRQASRIAAAY